MLLDTEEKTKPFSSLLTILKNGTKSRVLTSSDLSQEGKILSNVRTVFYWNSKMSPGEHCFIGKCFFFFFFLLVYHSLTYFIAACFLLKKH